MALFYFWPRSLLRIANFQSPALKIATTSARRCEDAPETADPRIIPKEEFFRSADDRERDEMLREHFLPPTEDATPVNFVPKGLLAVRRARIHKKSKNCMQSGTDNCIFWRISFDTEARWEQPLQGWTAAGDPLAFVVLNFTTEEEAIAHCDRNGWSYYVDMPNEIRTRAKSYTRIFSWDRRFRASTK